MHIAPEPASASAATRALPMRRLHWPPAMQPIAPTPMTMKLSNATEGDALAPARRASSATSGAHSHGTMLQNA